MVTAATLSLAGSRSTRRDTLPQTRWIAAGSTSVVLRAFAASCMKTLRFFIPHGKDTAAGKADESMPLPVFLSQLVKSASATSCAPPNQRPVNSFASRTLAQPLTLTREFFSHAAELSLAMPVAATSDSASDAPSGHLAIATNPVYATIVVLVSDEVTSYFNSLILLLFHHESRLIK
jgi:hypothetical protein